MRKYSIALCIVLLCLLCVTPGYNRRNPDFQNSWPARRNSNEFDVLIFTQRWPLTACFVWKTIPQHTVACYLNAMNGPSMEFGLQRYKTIGPQFCDKTLKFNPSIVAPIENELKENWIDIHKGSNPYTFWKHEWEKHGTCAITIKTLNNEFNYFQEGLKLLDTYNMIDVLAKANILPGNKYMVQQMFMGIQKVLGKRGQITCVVDKNGESYVIEIRICFDKTLQLTDCDGISGFPTNCNKAKEIIYPSRVPHYYVTQA